MSGLGIGVLVAAMVPWTGGTGADSVPESTPEPEAMVGRVWVGAATEASWSGGTGGALQLMEARVEVELAPGVRVHGHAQRKWGYDGAAFPSAQGLSSLEAEDFSGFGEAWAEWAGPAWRVKAGRVDANTEFAGVAAASGFANPSFGLSPVLGVLPSYPAPAPSIGLFGRPDPAGPAGGVSVFRTPEGDWSGAAGLSGEVGSGIRWSVGAAGALDAERWRAAPRGPADGGGAGPPAGGAWAMVERPGSSARPFLVVSRALDGTGMTHGAGGVAWPAPVVPGGEAGVAVSAVVGPRLSAEAVYEAYLSVLPVPWLRVHADAQLRVARGLRPAWAGLIRVVLER